MGSQTDRGSSREHEKRDLSDRRTGEEKARIVGYTVRYEPKAIQTLQKLPENIRKRIYDKTISAKTNPFHFFERLEGRIDYKLRVGDYRVLADIDVINRIIHVTVIGHRKNIYKSLP